MVNSTRLSAGTKKRAWAWTVADFAALFGVTEARVGQMIQAGEFDPSNLESVCVTWLERTRSPRYARHWDVPPCSAVLQDDDRSSDDRTVQVGGNTYTLRIPKAFLQPDLKRSK